MNKKDEKIIKDAEKNKTPIFVLTAKDELSIDALEAYFVECVNVGCDDDHLDGIQDRISEFKYWQQSNESKVKIPD